MASMNINFCVFGHELSFTLQGGYSAPTKEPEETKKIPVGFAIMDTQDTDEK